MIRDIVMVAGMVVTVDMVAMLWADVVMVAH